ncbi:MAG: DUF4198 domain-containing protein [Comamonas sp.]
MSLTSTSSILLRATALGALLLACTAQAHNVWLESDAQGGYVMQFGGHEGKVEPFDPAKLQRVHAYDLRGRAVDSQVQRLADGIRIQPDARAALIAVELDNGFFSTTGGDAQMQHLPMDRNPGAVRGVHARKFHKTVVQWGAVMQKPLGQTFELVPQQGRQPQAGQPLKLLVLLDGQPRAGVRLSWGEHGSPVTSDAQGMATVVPAPGTNTLQAILRVPVLGDARTTENSYEYLLRFAAH